MRAFLDLFLGLILGASSLPSQIALSQTAPSQTATYSFVGKDCGSSSIQMLEVQGLPKLGTTFYLVTSGSNSSNPIAWTANFLFTGFSNKNFRGLNLPFDLSRLSRLRNTFCGILRNNIFVVDIAPELVPRHKFPFIIPNDRTLLGIKFFNQAFRLKGFFDLRKQQWTYFYDISRGGEAVVGL